MLTDPPTDFYITKYLTFCNISRIFFLNVFNELYYNRCKIIKREADSSINRSNNISPSPYSHVLYYIMLYYIMLCHKYYAIFFIRFFKNGCNWGGWGIFTYLQLSLHSWQRVLTPPPPYFMKTTPFFKILSKPPSPPTP